MTVGNFPAFFPLASRLALACAVFDSRGSSDDLSGPPHGLPRGFLCGSPADLSGLPAEGLGHRPTRPPLIPHHRPVPAGHLIRATGGPLRGIGGFSDRGGAAREGDANCFAALPGRTAAAIAPTLANPGQVFSAGRLYTILGHSAGLVSISGALPACVPPIGAASLASKGLGEGSHCPAEASLRSRAQIFGLWYLGHADMDLVLGRTKKSPVRTRRRHTCPICLNAGHHAQTCRDILLPGTIQHSNGYMKK